MELLFLPPVTVGAFF
jgi:hypothetical protein